MRRRPRACFQLFSIRWHRARAIARSTRDFLVVVDQVVLVGSGRWRRRQEWLICCWKGLAIRLLDAHWTFRLLTCSWCFHQEEIAYYTHGVNNYSLVVGCSRCKGRHDGCEFCFCFVSRTMWLKASAKKKWWIGKDGVHLLAFWVMQIVVKVQRHPEEESELNLLSIQGPVPNWYRDIYYTIFSTLF